MVAWAAATRECTMASSLLVALVVAAVMSDMSSGTELPMLWITSSSGTILAGDGDGCRADIDADARDGAGG